MSNPTTACVTAATPASQIIVGIPVGVIGAYGLEVNEYSFTPETAVAVSCTESPAQTKPEGTTVLLTIVGNDLTECVKVAVEEHIPSVAVIVKVVFEFTVSD